MFANINAYIYLYKADIVWDASKNLAIQIRCVTSLDPHSFYKRSEIWVKNKIS